MAKISANLGFLWTELPLPDAIRTAHQYGFDGVECHFPYDSDVAQVQQALADTGMPMIGINTTPGSQPGDSGLCAIADRVEEAREAIDQAITYAKAINAHAVHVMPGIVPNAQQAGPIRDNAQHTFCANLRYAHSLVTGTDIKILIEPLNHFDKPDYFLNNSVHAEQIITETACSSVKIMYDCYHIQRMEGNVVHRYQQIQHHIGHIQIASSPTRNEPNVGELNYSYVLSEITKLGYDGFFGAEYISTGQKTENTLDWLSTFQQI